MQATTEDQYTLMIERDLNSGIDGSRSKVNTGVWVGKNKICTVGVSASRWVTMHGLALNVLPDLKNFDQIKGVRMQGTITLCSLDGCNRAGLWRVGVLHVLSPLLVLMMINPLK